MSGVVDLLVRSVLVLTGYAFAALCASAFLHLVTLPLLGFDAAEMPAIAAGSIIFSVPFVALFVAYFAFFPALLAILAGEVLKLRDWLYYAIAGGVVGVVVTGYFRAAADVEHPVSTEPLFVMALVGAGMCGGLGYWLVAGRSCGGSRRGPGEITSPAPK